MTDQEFKAKISLLNNVKPREDWVLLTKKQILGETIVFKPKIESFSLLSDIVATFKVAIAKPALVMPIIALIVVGGVILQLSVSTLPGDALYPVKVALSKAKISLLTSNDAKLLAQIDLAQSSLDDLKRAAQENRVKNLASAIQVFEDNISVASKEIQELVENQSSGALQVAMEVVQLQKDKVVVEQILGTAIGNDSGEFESAVKLLVESELSDLQERSLTDAQEALVVEAQKSYEAGDYESALESIWMISNN